MYILDTCLPELRVLSFLSREKYVNKRQQLYLTDMETSISHILEIFSKYSDIHETKLCLKRH